MFKAQASYLPYVTYGYVNKIHNFLSSFLDAGAVCTITVVHMFLLLYILLYMPF